MSPTKTTTVAPTAAAMITQYYNTHGYPDFEDNWITEHNSLYMWMKTNNWGFGPLEFPGTEPVHATLGLMFYTDVIVGYHFVNSLEWHWTSSFHVHNYVANNRPMMVLLFRPPHPTQWHWDTLVGWSIDEYGEWMIVNDPADATEKPVGWNTYEKAIVYPKPGTWQASAHIDKQIDTDGTVVVPVEAQQIVDSQTGQPVPNNGMKAYQANALADPAGIQIAFFGVKRPPFRTKTAGLSEQSRPLFRRKPATL